MSSSTLDYLHASVLFSSSLLSEEEFDLSASHVFLAQTCLFFLSDHAVYVYPYTTTPRSSQTTKPIPVLYNIEHFVLLDDLGCNLIVLNGSGELVYLQIEFETPTNASVASREEAACNITNHILLTNALQTCHLDVRSMTYSEYYKALYISFHGSNQVVHIPIPRHPTHFQSNPIEISTISMSLDTKPATTATSTTNSANASADNSHHHDVLQSVWGSRHHPCMVYTYPSANAYIYFYDFSTQSNNTSTSNNNNSDNQQENIPEEAITTETRTLYRRKGVHKTQISCLSSMSICSTPPPTPSTLDMDIDKDKDINITNDTPGGLLDSPEWALSGDLSGGVCVWQFIIPSIKIIDDPEDGNPLQPNTNPKPTTTTTKHKGKWKLMWYEKYLTNYSAIDQIYIDAANYHTSNRTACLCDRSGKVSIVHLSLRNMLAYAVQTLHLFPSGYRIVILSRMHIQEGTSELLRVYSDTLGEVVECAVCKHISCIYRVWPDNDLYTPMQASAKQQMPMEFTTTRTIQPNVSASLGQVGMGKKVVYASTLLSHAQLLVVSDWTSSLLFYDLHSNELLYTLQGVCKHPTVLLGWDEDYTSTQTLLLCVGHSNGLVAVYRLSLTVNPQYNPNASLDGTDEESEYSLEAYSDDSAESQQSESQTPSLSLANSSTVSLVDSLMIDRQQQQHREDYQKPVFDLLNEAQFASALLAEHEHSGGLVPNKHAEELLEAPGSISPDCLYRLPFFPSPTTSSNTNMSAYIMKHRVLHILHPNISPVTDLFISSLGRCLVLGYQRRYLYSYPQLLQADATCVDEDASTTVQGEEEEEGEGLEEELLEGADRIEGDSKANSKHPNNEIKNNSKNNKKTGTGGHKETKSSRKDATAPTVPFAAAAGSKTATGKPTTNTSSSAPASRRNSGYASRKNSAVPSPPPPIPPLQNYRELVLDNIQNHISVLHAVPSSSGNERKEVEEEDRLLLVLQSSFTIRLLNGLNLTNLASFSLESTATISASLARGTAPSSPRAFPPAHATTTSPSSSTSGTSSGSSSASIGKIVMWDYHHPHPSSTSTNNTNGNDISSGNEKAKEHGLIGLYGPELFQWMSFSDQAGFKHLHDLHNHLDDVYQTHTHLHSRAQTKLDRLIWRLSGFHAGLSPIVLASSSKFMALFRLQLDHVSGPMVMRNKLFALGYSPLIPTESFFFFQHKHDTNASTNSTSNSANKRQSAVVAAAPSTSSTSSTSNNNEVLFAQALPLLPKVRYHQALIVLASGFAFVVKL